MLEITFLAVIALGGALVFDGLRAREAAIRVAKDACHRQHLLFLDDTVRNTRTRLARDPLRRAFFRRAFVFEFSEDGLNRRSGCVVMLGAEAESVQLEPYRVA